MENSEFLPDIPPASSHTSIDGLIEEIAMISPLSVQQERLIREKFVRIKYRKKDVVLEQGAIVQEIYFIASGIICMYGLDDKGSSHALQFGIPGWWLTDLNAFMNGSAAEYKIECAEHCELLALSRKDYLQLTGAISSFQIYMHQVILNKYNRAIKKIELLMCENAEDRFQKFTAAFPQFVNQVPQYILASVLGFTPQFLSMLRSRLKK